MSLSAKGSPEVVQTSQTSGDSVGRSAETVAPPDSQKGSNSTKTIELPYLNNPDKIAPVRVDVTSPPSIRDQQITRAVRLVRPDLFGRPSHTHATVARAHRITIRELGGGLSNYLFVVHPGERDEAVLVRIHAEDEGNDGDASASEGEAAARADTISESESEVSTAPVSFVDRMLENKVMAWLSSKGLAPTFHGLFLNGRIEEFYDGYRPLSWDELALPKFAVPIARAMADLHGVQPPDNVMNVPEKQRREGEIWSRIEDWLGMARNADEDNDASNDMIQSILNEWEWLKQVLRHSGTSDSLTTTSSSDLIIDNSDDVGTAALTFFRQVVFTHMDAQSLNILTPSEGFLFDSEDSDDSGNDVAVTRKSSAPKDGSGREKASVRLIDFEYTGLNPRAVDIANTFCEHTNMNNLEPKYEEQYPTDKQQDVFLHAYVTRANPTVAKQLSRIENGWEIFLSVARDEIGRDTLLSNIGWAIWAVAQASMSKIDFDYLRYARLRIDGYYYFKERYWGGHE